MDGPGVVEWLAIGLSVAAIIVILRYGRRPRCEQCARQPATRRPHRHAVSRRGAERTETARHGTPAGWRAERLAPLSAADADVASPN